MKYSLTPIDGTRSGPLGKHRPLKPRSSYPTLSVVPLHRSPLRRLAWIFGFGR